MKTNQSQIKKEKGFEGWSQKSPSWWQWPPNRWRWNCWIKQGPLLSRRKGISSSRLLWWIATHSDVCLLNGAKKTRVIVSSSTENLSSTNRRPFPNETSGPFFPNGVLLSFYYLFVYLSKNNCSLGQLKYLASSKSNKSGWPTTTWCHFFSFY